MQILHRLVERETLLRGINIFNRAFLLQTILLMLIGLSWIECNALNVQSASQIGSETKDINLVLKTDKLNYRIGEPIILTAYLVNSSNTNYFVGKTFMGFLGTLGLHDITLEVFDKRGNKVSINRHGGNWIWKPDATLSDKLEQSYLLLEPNNIHGITDELNLNLKSGQYELQVFYREKEALRWTKNELQSLSYLIWTQPLHSNMITISIGRVDRNKSVN